MQTFISTRELLSYLHKNHIPSIFFKIDFSKAYDTISWEFLLEVFEGSQVSSAVDILDKKLIDLIHIAR
jgi:hypothetical protein